MDSDLSKDIRIIIPDKVSVVNTKRLGEKHQGHFRPLRISLSSKKDVSDVLRNKYWYSGPVKISQDLTTISRIFNLN